MSALDQLVLAGAVIALAWRLGRLEQRAAYLEHFFAGHVYDHERSPM